jgi:hypothetical protein
MEQHKTFVFSSFGYDPRANRIDLGYTLDGETRFRETLEIKTNLSPVAVPQRLANRALLGLHLAGGTSYYKTCCPKTMDVQSGDLSEGQTLFWNTVYTEGLGEFFYKNQIDPTGLVRFPITRMGGHAEAGRDIRKGSVLVPIGGGKDSIVTIELLKEAGYDVTLLRMGSHPLIDKAVKVTGLPVITVERTLSAKLFELNKEGALNGHVPITAYLSFLATFVALQYGFEAVIMSNERSASEGNVEWKGRVINHQWSKSLAFEEMFQEYVKDYITPDLSYFSLLRPLSELGIAKLFTHYPQYFAVTTSCNANWRILEEKPANLWVHSDPKTAFVFALYAAFLPRETLTQIFGGLTFDAPEAQTLYRELLGLQGHKPFECVGTPEETKAAFLLAHKRGDLEDTKAMQMFVRDVLPLVNDPMRKIESSLKPSTDHRIPREFQSLMRSFSLQEVAAVA